MSAFEELTLDEPLPLIILVKGSDITRVEKLVKDAIPMLLRPEDFSLQQRSQLAENFRLALGGEE